MNKRKQKTSHNTTKANANMSCTNCPRHCKVSPGFCGANTEMPEVAAVYAHTGEEPPISGKRGISNIFFAHCNMQCCFCQNHQISRRHVSPSCITLRGISQIVDAVIGSLHHTENIVGFVSASHYADSLPSIVEELHRQGCFPTVVYNTGGYDSVETLRRIAPYVDIYLPDYKYADADIAARYSNAADYPRVAGLALKEMYNQMGSSLPTDDDGMAFRGMVVRHLVLPGAVENSIHCLEWLSDNLSVNIHLSLMAQYYPPDGITLPSELRRRVNAEEYNQVVERLHSLGFNRGWVQQLDAADNYKPHFNQETFFI